MMNEIDPELLDCFVTEASDALATWEKSCLDFTPANSETSLNAIFRVAHNLKGSSRSIGLEALGAFIHEVEDFISEIKSEPSKINDRTIRSLLSVQSFLSGWMENLSSNPGYSPDTGPIILSLRSLEEASDSNRPLVEVEVDAPKDANNNSKSSNPNETIRVKSQKLDQLIQVIGELGIQQAIVAHCVKSNQFQRADFVKALNMVSKMAKEIQAQSIALRMLELQSLFQRIERTGKEVSHELGKKIEFIIEGSELELDKVVIETITEPLIHIIRNAVDHGIEMPEKRSQNQKQAQAKVWISARKETDAVRISIKDDGKGIDPEVIRKKAIEKGLIQAADNISKEDILQLIFAPGFSTAEKITSVSGRGVGMDVVRQAIDSVGGRIEIESETGKGSCFTLSLPTTMNIIDSVVVEVLGERLVIPLNHVLEIIDLDTNKITSREGEALHVLQLRDQLIPIELLHSYVRFGNIPEQDQIKKQSPAIISGSGRGSVAFKVDRIIGQQRVIVKPISGRQKYPPQISGATVLSDGKPGFIVALSTLADKISGNYRKLKEAS